MELWANYMGQVAQTIAIMALGLLARDEASSMKLAFDSKQWIFTVPAKVNGRAASAIIDLSMEETLVDSSFVSRLAKLGQRLKADVSVLNVGPTQVDAEPTEGLGLISIGRGFFKNKVLIWDIPNGSLTVTDEREDASKGVSISSNGGYFFPGKRRALLPQISPVSRVPSGLQTSDGFDFFRPSQTVKVIDKARVFGLTLHERIQAVVISSGYDDTTQEVTEKNVRYYPGATFFGDQTVTIDFKNNRIHFTDSEISRNLFLFRLMLSLPKFEIKNDQLILREIDQTGRLRFFEERGAIGLALKRIGRIEIAVSRFKDRSFLMSVLKELESGGELEFGEAGKMMAMKL